MANENKMEMFQLMLVGRPARLLFQFTWAPEKCTTLAHFSVSTAIVRPSSSGEPGSATPPRLAMRSLIFGSAMARFPSLLSRVMISGGVAFGAHRPFQALAR